MIQQRSLCGRLICGLALSWAASSAAATENTYSIREPATPARIDRVEIHVTVSGTAEFAIEKGQALAHPIAADATLKYRERRLPGAGRDAEALRGLRYYDALQAQIRVAEHVTAPRLAEDRRLLIAQGRRDGILFYSPRGALTASELELLRAPGDSLCLLALLPPDPVAIGAKWNPESWVGQMFTDTEAASKSELTCSLDSVSDGIAKVKFEGTVVGATAGSTGTIQIHGSYLFDLKSNRLSRAEIEQTEQRTIGPVSPGMRVTAKSVVVRTSTDDAKNLSEEQAAAIPLDPPPGSTQLRFRAPWNVEFSHDRTWHVFQQSDQVAVLRLMDQGTFVAQCNLAPLRPVGPGEHVAEERFQNDIRTSLGPRLKTIEKAETIKTQDGRFLYRVAAEGTSNGVPITWIYYLCAAPDGSQVSLVFAVDTALRARLGDRDVQILKSLRFLEPQAAPEKAERPKTPAQ